MFLPLQRLCRNGTNAVIVILNEVKNLIISTESIIEILRPMPQDDIATQSLQGGGQEGDGVSVGVVLNLPKFYVFLMGNGV